MPDENGWLILSRKRDEDVMIGDDIQVRVVEIRGDKVRLGFKAPPNVAVHRSEVYAAILREHGGEGLRQATQEIGP